MILFAGLCTEKKSRLADRDFVAKFQYTSFALSLCF